MKTARPLHTGFCTLPSSCNQACAAFASKMEASCSLIDLLSCGFYDMGAVFPSSVDQLVSCPRRQKPAALALAEHMMLALQACTLKAEARAPQKVGQAPLSKIPIHFPQIHTNVPGAGEKGAPWKSKTFGWDVMTAEDRN